jgi:hypothetical protein
MEENKLIKANEDFELLMKEIKKWHKWQVTKQMRFENRIDEQKEVLMVQKDHRNFAQYYQSNLN